MGAAAPAATRSCSSTPSKSGVGAGHRDRITDFSHADGDQIVVSSLAPGDEQMLFIGTSAFDAADEVRYFPQRREHDRADQSPNQDALPEMEIQLDGSLTLQESDFVPVLMPAP